MREVAGKSTDAVSNISMEHEHNLIDIAIQKLKDDHKPCCETMCDPCFCPVCICYENLCILGFWDASGEKNDRGENEDSSFLPWTNGLLRRFHPTDQGIWFTTAGQKTANTNRSTSGCPQQLLLFDPFHDDQGSYYSIPAGFGKEELAYSMNARMMLRLGHSADVLQSLSIKVKKLRSNATPQRKCNPDRDNSSVMKDKAGSEEGTAMPSELEECFSLASFVWSTSLTLAHVSATAKPSHWSTCSPVFRFVSFIQTQQHDKRQKSNKPLFITRPQMVKRREQALNSMLTAMVDGILGLVLGIIILSNREVSASICYSLWSFLHDRLLKANIGWLETFPVGFKLNLALTKNMGCEILALIKLQERLFSAAEGGGLWIMATIAGVVSSTLGISGFFSLMFDVARFSTLHVALFASSFRALYRTELYLFSALWRLCRGKKQNYLRRRTDTMEYDATQLLLGMILFSMVIFLFTTILVYYLFFAILDLLRSSILAAMWFGCIVQRKVPYGSFVFRMTHPGWYASTSYFEDVNVSTGTPGTPGTPVPSSKRFITRLVSNPQSLSHVMSIKISPCLTVFSSMFRSQLTNILVGMSNSVGHECLKRAGL